MRSFLVLSLFIVCAHINIPTLYAQVRPDAGTLLQEKRQQPPKLPAKMPAPPVEEAKPALMDTGIRVFVKGFRFTGYEGLATEAELQQIVKGYVGRNLDFSQLQAAATDITRYLRDTKKYVLARAYIPKQDVTEGIVTISILSGRLDGATHIRLKEPYRVKKSLIEGIASEALPEGKPVQMEDVERAALIMNDLPGIDARASLEPGTKPGTTQVSMDVSEGSLLQGLVSADNFGDRYTGEWRTTGQAAVNDPFGLADKLTVAWTHAERQDMFCAGYAVPLGKSGLKMTASYTGLAYRIGKELSDLDAKGWADTFSSGLIYPLVRTRNKSITLGVNLEYLRLVDETLGEKTQDRAVWDANMSLSADMYDTFGGGGMTNATISFFGGKVDLSGLSLYEELDKAGAGTQGSFFRATYYVSRLQNVTERFSLFGSLRGQFATQNLDSSQKFILGGPYGVRAYPVGEAPGDEGHSITLEARYDLPFMPSFAATQLVGFFDAGWVKLHHSPWAGCNSTSSGENDYFLSGAGMGINIGKPGLYALRASYAFKIGPNKGSSFLGNDADGLSDNGRFWLQFTLWH